MRIGISVSDSTESKFILVEAEIYFFYLFFLSIPKLDLKFERALIYKLFDSDFSRPDGK